MLDNYGGDLLKATGGVQAIVIGYDRATLVCDLSAQALIIEGVEQVTGENDIDQLWLDMLRLRHAVGKLGDSHDGCMQLCMNLVPLPGAADRLGLPTLNKVFFALMEDTFNRHSGCIEKTLFAAKAKAEADPQAPKADTSNPTERLREYGTWTAEMGAVGAVVAAAGLAAIAGLAELLRRAK